MEAYVTLLFSDDYLVGVLTLAHALRETGTERQIVVLVTESVSQASRDAIEQVFDSVIDVKHVENPHPNSTEFVLLNRPELQPSYSKIALWGIPYKKVVYLDADVLVTRNIDDLFEVEIGPLQVAAAPDIGWPDIFNSGVLVAVPNKEALTDLTARASHNQSFDGGDQGLLNQYFENSWVRIPFAYNVTPSTSYQYAPAFRHFQSQVRNVHFVGSVKPWSPHSEQSDQYVQQWHQICGRYPDTARYLPEATQQKFHRLKQTALEGGHGLRVDSAEPQGQAAKQSTNEEEDNARFDRFGGYFSKKTPSHTIAPPPNRWDPTQSVPPRRSGPEAANLNVKYFDNVWDKPAEDLEEVRKQAEQFRAPKLGPSLAPFPWETRESTIKEKSGPPPAPTSAQVSAPATSHPAAPQRPAPHHGLHTYKSRVMGTQESPDPPERVFPDDPPRRSKPKKEKHKEQKEHKEKHKEKHKHKEKSRAREVEQDRPQTERIFPSDDLVWQTSQQPERIFPPGDLVGRANRPAHLDLRGTEPSELQGFDQSQSAWDMPQIDAFVRQHARHARTLSDIVAQNTESKSSAQQGKKTKLPVTPHVGTTPTEELGQDEAFPSGSAGPWNPDAKLKELARLPAKLLARESEGKEELRELRPSKENTKPLKGVLKHSRSSSGSTDGSNFHSSRK
uniref:glycogenin glucosyltransferase n=1 Tax=Blastobotrys adeninivorans TaxID=409370 RepID=A0A060SWD9_BLAAD